LLDLAQAGIPDFAFAEKMTNEASSSSGSSFASWRSEVQAAVDESNSEKLLERVHAAEIAIFNRLQELAKETKLVSFHHAEREALDSALETLRLIKRDRLGFPDWKK
jgi:hypothetical protein